jgi:hypothetical protein
MTTNANAAATCTICAGPLADDKPVTDAKGRPVCATCVERARKAKLAAKAPAKPTANGGKPAAAADHADDNAFLLEIGGSKAQALSGGKPCPQCELVMNQQDRVCLSCGYDFESGKKVRTKIEKAPKAKQGGGASGGGQKVAMAILALAAVGAAAWYFLYGQG